MPDFNIGVSEDVTIGDRIPVPVAIDPTATAFDAGRGVQFSYSVNGLGFLSAASSEASYQRGLAAVSKDRVDNSEQPGDQSFNNWWLRSQTDWSVGAGTEYMEPIREEKVQRSFSSSYGVDVWTPGQVSLLPAVESVASRTAAGNTTLVNALVTNSGSFVEWSADRTYVACGDKVVFYYGDDWTEVTVLASPNLTTAEYVTNLTVGQGYVYACTNKSVWVLEGNGWVGSHLYPSSPPLPGQPTKVFDFPATDMSARAFFVKDRLVMSQKGYVWDEAPPAPLGGSTTLSTATALYNAGEGTQWIATVEHPAGIFMAAANQTGTTIYSLSLDTTGTLPVLAAPAVAAEFPIGEQVTQVATYLGAYILIGTTLGIRVGTINNGNIAYGPVVESPVPTGPFSVFDRFAFYPTDDAGEGRSGLVRIDLSEIDETGRVAWACDRRVPDGADAVACSAIGVDGDVRMVTSDGTTVAVYADSGLLEASGFLGTGFIRFGTTEAKYFDSVNVQLDPSWAGRVRVYTVDDTGVTRSIAAFTPASGQNVDLRFRTAVGFGLTSLLALGFKLEADADLLTGPVLQSWQVRALPAVPRQRILQIPLLCYDHESDSRGVPYGYEGYALDRFEAVERVSISGEPFTLEDLVNGKSYRVVLEDLTFTQITPPVNASGFGGLLVLRVRVL